MKKHIGFTLIEMIMVIVIMGIIAIVASRLFSAGLNAYLTDKNVIDATAQARLAMEVMTRDIRAIRSPSDITTATATQLVFTNTSENSVTYALSGGTLTRNSQALADGILSLTFTYFDNTGTGSPSISNIRYVTITLNVTQGGTNFTIATSVYPRNLL